MDRETVIRQIENILEICKENKWLTHFTSDVIYPILHDALAMLKEQEAKKPKRDPVWEFVCPRDGCNHRLRFLQSYCDLCGQALNWKEI